MTGSGRGIGEGIALVLAREGANLVINDRKITADAEGVVKKIKAMGGQAIAVEADVSKKSEVTAMAEQAVKQFGAIDILVNNAGIESHPVMTTDLAEESWDRVLTVNLKGSFLCCQAVIPQMIKQNKGRIINIGSTASIRIAFFGGVEYTASKYGQAGLAAHLAWELADFNITVNSVCPGAVQTPLMEQGTTPEYREMTVKRLIPLGRFSTIEDIGEAVSFLASDRAAMITGLMLPVDGGALTGFGEDLRPVVRQKNGGSQSRRHEVTEHRLEILPRQYLDIAQAYGEKAPMTTKEEGPQQKGIDRRQFATNTGALLGMLAVGAPALGAADEKQVPASASARNRSPEGTSTGPWDNPALAKFREWDPLWVEQCLKMSERSVDQRRAAAQRRRVDQSCGECGVYDLEPRGNPPAYSRRTGSRRQPRRDPDDPEGLVASRDPYVQPGRTHSAGRSEGDRCEANAEGGADAGLRQDESRGPVESGVGRIL